MGRYLWIIFLWMPPVFLALHIAAMVTLDEPTREWFMSEYGPSELAAALVFLATGLAAAFHAWKFWRVLPRVPRVLFCLLAAGCVFIAVEEVSYGQWFLGYQSPAWFAEHNNQEEFNLHNLAGDKPSRLLRRVGELGLPVVAFVLPLVLARRPGAYAPGTFAFYLFPRFELVPALLGSAAIRIIWWLRKSVMESYVWTSGLSELQEVMWAWAGLITVIVLHRRLAASQAALAAAAPSASAAPPPPVG